MNVLFVYSDISGEYYGAKKYYAGLATLASVLREAGHDVALLYLQQEIDGDAFLVQVAEHNPDMVAFSATTHQYPYIQRYAEALKAARPDLPTVCGGIHPTLVPEKVVTCEAFDAVCVGEGEYALRELAERVATGRDFGDVANIWVQRYGEIIRNPGRSLIDNLDELPFGDRTIFHYDQLLAENHGWVDMMSGRGCPYNCSYCCNHALRGRYKGLGRYVRFRGIEHIMAELRELAQRYDVRTINFQDDIFTLDRDWTLAFCEAYRSEFDWPFWINSRVERMTDETVVKALADAHCAGLRIGVESGNEDLRTTVLRRRMSNEDIIHAVRLAQKHGIKTYTTNMIGIPGETYEMLQSTIDLTRELAPDEFQFSVFYPYPMTVLGDRCVEENLIKPDIEIDSYFEQQSILNLPTLTDAELERGYARFEALKTELALKRSNPRKYEIYLRLLKLYGGDSPRLLKHLDTLRAARKKLVALARHKRAA